jgi:transposase
MESWLRLRLERTLVSIQHQKNKIEFSPIFIGHHRKNRKRKGNMYNKHYAFSFFI